MSTPRNFSIKHPMKATITVHKVTERNVVADLHLYCGRNGAQYPEFINAKLGNPFDMKDESQREAVCDNYACWLEGQGPDDYARLAVLRLAQRLKEGKSIALYCHCAPRRCHCETIRDFALWSFTQQSQ